MYIAYIITVYHKPEQLVRLIRNLSSENTWFFIHLDKTKEYSAFESAFNDISKIAKVKFLKREDSRWGRWGFTKAMINGLIEINKEKVPFDYILTLSGQDQPIKSNHYINEFLEQNKGRNFIEHFAMPYAEWNFGGMDRLEHYHFDFLGREYAYPAKKPLKGYKDKVLNWLYGWYFPLPRKMPGNLSPYGGSCWFCITGDTAKYITNYLNEHPGYIKYHQYTYLPDEIFFQTILMNTDNEDILSSIINKNLTYIEWEGEAHVVVFTKNDYSKLASSDKLFARKFDLSQDPEILSMVEKNVLHKVGNKDISNF